LPLQRETALRDGTGHWQDFCDAIRFSLPASLLRGMAAWTRETLSGWLTPAELPIKVGDTLRGHYQMVYGDGFALNNRELDALIGVGNILAGSGCQTLYYLTPVDRLELGKQMGAAVVEQLDASAAQVVKVLRQAGYPVLDLHALLNSGFIELPSEHLAAAGRLAVAKRLNVWVAEHLLHSSSRTRVESAGFEGLRRAAIP
ncbi:MAG: hypothetical protein ACREKE_04055, partial [bacterium]